MDNEQQLAAWQALTEQTLETLLPRLLQQGSVVAQAAAYSLLGGGKRVRGVLALAACQLACGQAEAAAGYAAALEMLHCYSLIHDDLPCMDDDDMRRGKPACHKAFGEANALLAGDALLTAAFAALGQSGLSEAQNARAMVRLADAAGGRGMVYGQELDLAAEQCPVDEDGLLRIHQNKTGALIRAAAALGAIAGAAGGAQCAALDAYAADLGTVFQIVDDVLDVTATAQQLGKPIGSDRENGKTTFVTLLGVDGARQRARQLTQRAGAALNACFGADAAFLQWFADRLLQRSF